MVNDAFEIMFNLKAEEEGVVLKLADSKYKPGGNADPRTYSQLAVPTLYKLYTFTIDRIQSCEEPGGFNPCLNGT